MNNQNSTSKSEKQKRPSLHSLRGDYAIPEPVKKKFGLDTLLKTNAGSWTNPGALIDAYFMNCLTWEPSSRKFFEALSIGLQKFGSSGSETLKARKYALEVSTFINSAAVINKSKVYYQLMAAKAEAERQEILAKLHGEAAGAAFASVGANKLRKRALDQLFADEESENDVPLDEALITTPKKTKETSFVINKGGHSYQLYTPTKEFFCSPQKPIIEHTDRLTCSQYFDLRLSTDTVSKCSDGLEKEYQDHVREMRVNSSLISVSSDNYVQFNKQLYDVDMSNFSQEIFHIDQRHIHHRRQ
ncbi:hypothetical protein BDF20DRAFT_29511 [Mycotypha africana]|uniref:uncharacterized protein n=1 Tax=Mycotypha africana TaxID=64632 RepID=UPI00230065BB|nr:uncharacterized protein BDF20DRAFT_29511 [Mycotypha africana]KAI8991197.1 hypothetical protein BDF20DRAFT_29511 [Mycotypha africana]